MSMLGTLAKVAIGVAIAKGASSVLKGAGTAGGGSAGGGSVFGDTFSPQGQSRGQTQGGTGLEDMLSDAFSGGPKSRQRGAAQAGTATSNGGGLGELLESLSRGSAGGAQTQAPSGGLDDLLQGLGGGQAGGLGDLLGGLLGGAAGGATAGSGRGDSRPGGSFGDLLNDALSGRREPQTPPTAHQDAAAALMLKAMIQAAKADGKIDQNEQQKLMGNLGEVSAQERAFVNAELQAPIDLNGLVRQVPRGLEQQVYAMSLMAIDLDSRNEAQYLDALAKGLKIDPQTANAIHRQMGVPALYR